MFTVWIIRLCILRKSVEMETGWLASSNPVDFATKLTIEFLERVGNLAIDSQPKQEEAISVFANILVQKDIQILLNTHAAKTWISGELYRNRIAQAILPPAMAEDTVESLLKRQTAMWAYFFNSCDLTIVKKVLELYDGSKGWLDPKEVQGILAH